MKPIKVFMLLYLLQVSAIAVTAQETWPSPEVEQMYKHAQEYVALGNFADAITIYKEAIILAQKKIVLYEGLGDAYYRAGKYADAEQVLMPLLDETGASARCYELTAASEAQQRKIKKARVTVGKGLERFPNSGLLYHEKGILFSLEKNRADALNAWLDGINKDAGYAPDYYETALAYLPAGKTIWGILYSEMYLAMTHDTVGDQIFKTKLLEGYKSFFMHIAGDKIPEYGQTNAKPPATTFEAAAKEVYSQLTPVISDGITTENLTMVRTRFLIDWFTVYGSKYPFDLFNYEDTLIRSGQFDKYNEWLFGKAESIPEYDAWNKFHEGEMNGFIEWKQGHVFVPANATIYNDRN